MAFKVGDKVTHRTFGAGEIAFGPYLSAFGVEHYLMAGEGGKHYIVGTEEGELKPAAKFKVGDRVKTFAATYTVEAGPFFAPAEWYVVKSDRTGDVLHSDAEGLSLVTPEPAKDEPLKPGDVVRIPRDNLQGADVKAGDLLVVAEIRSFGDIAVHAAPGARNPRWFFLPRNVERVDPATVAVVDNVAYDLTARYRDRDDDFWTFKDIDGTVRGNCSASNRETEVFYWCDSIADAARKYGPLTRV